MKDEPRIAAVLKACPDWIMWKLRSWLERQPAFGRFLGEHGDQIARKFREGISRDDQADVLAELEFAAAILADDRFSVSIQVAGTGHGRRPDFLVQSALQDFYLEIKRIRETRDTQCIQEFIGDIVRAAKEVASPLAFTVDILAENGDRIGYRLRRAAPAASAFCQQALADAAQTLEANATRLVGIPGFDDGEVTIRIHHVTGKDPASPTAYGSGITPVAHTQREWRKFGDHLSTCLWQLQPGMANVLGVKIDSTPHDPFDLMTAIQHLGENLVVGNDEFFRGKEFPGGWTEFMERARLLSAVVVKSMWVTLEKGDDQNCVWCNPDAAVPLVDGVINHLASMR